MSNRLEMAREVFSTEIEALAWVRDRLDESFPSAVEAVLRCRGKVVLTGLGKSGAVARKIASTFSSTGTPSVFLHATEGVHGGLGVIDHNDLLVAVSNSGETEELSLLVPAVKRLGVPLIAITGRADSTLARAAATVLCSAVPREACPLGLAPTSSTTAALVLGDALAVAVYRIRGFTEEDFAFRHPAGALGRSLLTVADLMHSGEELPLCPATAPLSDAILEMSRKKLGMTCVLGQDGKLDGILTDGDLRRLMQDHHHLRLDQSLLQVLRSRNPRTIEGQALAVQALNRMEAAKITSLIIVDGQGRPQGVIHIHDILRSKVV